MSPTAEDVVECHLSLDGRTVHRLSVDLQGAVKGVRYDAETLKESAWNSAGVSAAVLKEKKSFVTEIRVPFRTFGAKVRPEGTWRVNFVRRGPSCGGFSSWAPTNREQMDVESFGTLVFEGTADEMVGEPLAENLGKKAFLWTNGPWAKGRPDDRQPLERKELSSLAIAGPRGARPAARDFRKSGNVSRVNVVQVRIHRWCIGRGEGRRIKTRTPPLTAND